MGKDEEESKQQIASVTHLDGTLQEYKLSRSAEGEELFAKVTESVSIEEKDYFSLCFFDKERQRHWLYNDKKITRQLKGLPWNFSFQVKFYPTSPTTIADDHTRHNLFLQLRHDIQSERLNCTTPTKVELASYVAQADVGDAAATAEYEKFLRELGTSQGFKDEDIANVRQTHLQHKGMTTAEAEMKYLEVCKQLSGYGVFNFSAKDAKDVQVSIGISAHGINIYREQIRLHRFTWQNIIKIFYRKHSFGIRVKAGEIEKKETTLTFNLPSYEAAKRVWKCGVEHHTFFRLIQPDKKSKGGSLLRFGGSKFRYEGRTQFQTKMASQMFDQPGRNVHSPQSARNVPLENVAKTAVRTHSSVDAHNENGMSSPELHRSPEQTYTIMDGNGEKRRHHPEQVGASSTSSSYFVYSHKCLDPLDGGAAASQSLTASGPYVHVDSPKAAAYYPNYSISDCTSPLDGSEQKFFSGQQTHRQAAESRTTNSGSLSYGQTRSKQFGTAVPVDSSAIRSLCLHSPVDPPMDSVKDLEKGEDLPSIPFNLNGCAEDERPLASLGRARVVANGNVAETRPIQELSEYPIRYFVDVSHSGSSFVGRIEREIHSGEEDEVYAENVNRVQYDFFSSSRKSSVYRLERDFEHISTHILQCCQKYYESEPDDAHIEEELGTSKSRFAWLTRIRQLANRNGNLEQQERKEGFGEEKSTGETERTQTKSSSGKEAAAHSRRNIESKKDLTKQKSENRKKVRVEPEKYGIASTSYSGPVDQTVYLDELETIPLQDYANISNGQGGRDVIHDNEANLQAAKLVQTERKEMKTGNEVEKQKDAVIYITKVQKENEPEQENASSAPSKRDASKPLFGWLKSSGRRAGVHEEPSASDGYYESALLKYDGPLDSIDRGNDLESLPLNISVNLPTADAKEGDAEKEATPSGPSSPRRANLFYIRRLRHDGQEDVVEKQNIQCRAYDFSVEPFDGHIGVTPREDDLEILPLSEHAAAYHSGQSWNKEERSRKAQKPKRSEEQKEKTFFITNLPTETNQEETENVTPVGRNVTPVGRRGLNLHLPRIDWRFGRKSQQSETRADDVKMEDQSHEASKASSPDRFKLLFIRRLRHQGDDEVVEKENVKLENYAISTDPFDGPLEETPREPDLEILPLLEHSSVYHDGSSEKSSKAKKTKKSIESKVENEYGKEVEGINKDAVIYITKVQKENEPEQENASSAPSKRDASKPLFGWLRSSGCRADVHEKPSASDGYYESALLKYDGPLDNIDRGNDLESLPLNISVNLPTADAKEGDAEKEATPSGPSSPGRANLFYIRRLRHDGQEDVVEKQNIQSRAYDFSVEPFDGHIEVTPREDDLEILPLFEHAAAYHTGQSRNKEERSRKAQKPKRSEEQKEKTVLITKLPTETNQEETENVTPVGRRGLNLHLPRIDWRFGRKSQQSETPADDYKIEDENQEASKARSPERFKLLFIRRLRHQGDDEVVEKENVKLENYAISTDPFDGHLEETPREPDLEILPLLEHSSVYHDGSSEKSSKAKKTKKSIESKLENEYGKEVEGIKKDAVIYITKVQKENEPEQENASSAPSKRDASKPLFGWLKSSGRRAGVHEEPSASDGYYESALLKYAGPLDSIDRGNDLESLPLNISVNLPTADAKEGDAEKEATPSGPSSPRRANLFYIRRLRHDGQEDVVEKQNIQCRAYDFSVEPFDGHIEVTPREDDLEILPLSEHAVAYHSGQSWNKEERSRKAQKPKRSEEQKEKTVFITKLPTETNQEETENVTPVGRRGLNLHLPRIDWRFGRKSQQSETPADDVKMEDQSHEASKASSPDRFKLLFIRRLRHQGDDEVVEKENVKLANYAISTDPFDGPLEETPREPDLEILPLLEHSSVYHDGSSEKSSKAKKTKKSIESKLENEYGKEVEGIKKDAVIYITKVQKENEPEQENASSAPSKRDASKPLFGWLKSSGRRAGVPEEPSASDGYYESALLKYDGPLDSIDRGNDLESLPLNISVNLPTADAKEGDAEKEATPSGPSSPRRANLFYIRRLRHDGQEDVVEKQNIQCRAYDFSVEPFDGHIEVTPREDDLEILPLSEHAAAYHSGQSWNKEERSRKAQKSKRSEEQKEKTVFITKLPTETNQEETENVTPVGRRGLNLHLPRIDWRFGRKSQQSETPADDVKMEDQSHEASKASSPDRFKLLFIRRLRHQGDDEVVEKENVKLANYAISTDPFDGPLEETPREPDLEILPLLEHSSVYHDGSSEKSSKAKKTKKSIVSKVENEYGKEVEGIKKDAVIYITKVQNENEPEQENASSAPSKRDASKPLFGWLRSSGRRADVHEEPSASDGYYESALLKYDGPLDSIDRGNDLESLPLNISVNLPTADAKEGDAETEATPSGPSSPRRANLFYIRRLRHDGQEDVVEKQNIQSRAYDFSVEPFDGHIEVTPREDDLEILPLSEHAAAYHTGQSWNKKERSRKAQKPKRSEEQKDKTVFITKLPTETNQEETENVTPVGRRGLNLHLPRIDWRFGRKSQQSETPADDDKIEDENQEASKARSPERFKLLFIRRLRHQGNDEVVEKENVKLENYAISTDPFDGPLEETPREPDLEILPLLEHSSVYHDGSSEKSSKAKKTKKSIVSKVENEYRKEVEGIKKDAVIYITKVQNENEPEQENASSAPSKRDASKPLFGWLRSSGRRADVHEEPSASDGYYESALLKYDGPLDSIDRGNDLESLPLNISVNLPTADAKEGDAEKEATPSGPSSPRRANLFYIRRLRHDGQEDVVEKQNIQSRAYDFSVEPFDGHIEVTPREDDLEILPLSEHAAAYHTGQSWNKKERSRKAQKPKRSEEQKEKTVFITKLPTETNQEETENVTPVGRRGLNLHLPRIDWRFGRKSQQSETPADDEKTEDENQEESKARSPERFKFLFIRRLRHQGDDEVVEKENVKLENYAISTDPFDGPLEETPREPDLEILTLLEHSSVYHDGYSEKSSKAKKTKKSIVSKVNEYRKEVEGIKKDAVIYITKVQNENEPEQENASSAPSKRDASKPLFGWLRSSGRRADVHEEPSASDGYYESALLKYDGPLDSIDRGNDLESLPLNISVNLPTADAKEGDAEKEATPSGPSSPRRANLFYIRRLRHDGQEDVVEKQNIQSRAYDFSVEPFDGHIEVTPREDDLEILPLSEHAAAYHTGQSWNKKERSRKAQKPKRSEEQKDKTVFITKLPTETNQEETENVTPVGRRGLNLHLPRIDWRFGRKSQQSETPADDEKTEDENQEESKARSPERFKFLFIRRLRHQGDDEVVEKENVKMENYAISTDPFDGALEETPREPDLEILTLLEHSSVYHDGYSEKSSKAKKTKKSIVSKVENEYGKEVEGIKKDAVIYITKVQNENEPEQENASSAPSKRDASKPLFGWLRSSGRRADVHEEPSASDGYYESALLKYDGPLDSIDRGNDLESLPLNISVNLPTADAKEGDAEKEATPSGPSSPRRANLFYIRRIRHDGQEDVVEKQNIQSRAYDFSVEPFDGHIEVTPREDDLEILPLSEHAAAYHTGQSWNKKERSRKAQKPKRSEEQKEKTVFITKLPTETNQEETENVTPVGRRGLNLHLPRIDWRFGRKSQQSETPADDEKTEDENQEESKARSPERFKFLFIRRLRHQGDDEVVEKENVKLENYAISTDPFDGPLEETPREPDLEILTLLEHSSVYHDGYSEKSSKAKKTKKSIVSKVENEYGKEVEGIKKDAVIYITKVQNENEPEQENASSAPSKRDASKPLFGWLRSSGRRADVHEEPSASDGYYESALLKYDGPLDSIHRGNDLESLPLNISVNLPTADAKEGDAEKEATPSGPSSPRRANLFYIRRLRHDGQEDVVEKQIIQSRAYDFSVEPFDGHIEVTPREDDLEILPLSEHAAAYHTGQSWNKEELSRKAQKPKRSEEQKEKTVFITKLPTETNQEETENVTPVGRRGLNLHLPRIDWRFGRKSQQSETPADDNKIEDENQEASKARSPERFKLLFIRRLRHQGDDEVVEKENVKLENYAISTDPFDGPLEETPREPDLEILPLLEHSSVYHDGSSEKSSKAKKTKKSIVSKVENEYVKEVEGIKKDAVIYITKVQKENEPEQENTSSAPSKRDASKPLFGWLRSSGRRAEVHEEPSASDGYYESALLKYDGPLDSIDRGNDLESLPLNISVNLPTADAKEGDAEKEATPSGPSSPRRANLFYIRRLRHDGQEDVVEKQNIQSRAYDFSVEPFDGHIEVTPREEDLEILPLFEHAAAYHTGQSRYKEERKRSSKSNILEDETFVGNILSIKIYDEDECKPSPHSTNKMKNREEPVVKEGPSLNQKRFVLGNLSSGLFATGDASRDDYYVSQEPYIGTIESISYEADLDGLPLKHFVRRSVDHNLNGSATRTEKEEKKNLSSCKKREEEIKKLSREIEMGGENNMGGVEAVRIEIAMRYEIALEPIYCLATSSVESISAFPTSQLMNDSQPKRQPSFLRRLFRLKTSDGKSKKKKKETSGKEKGGDGLRKDSSSSSASSDDVNHEVVLQVQRMQSPIGANDKVIEISPDQLKVVRQETKASSYKLSGGGLLPDFRPDDAASGEPHTTVSSWNESCEQPDEVVVEKDEHGNVITRTIKTKQVKHTMRKTTVHNYSVDPNDQQGISLVEKEHQEAVPVQLPPVSGGVVQTHTRTVEYQAEQENANRDSALGEFVSSKTVTSGNRTVETITYKVEKNGVTETHVEHRVTIHSQDDIDHDAELSAAILEATNMNPDMTVQKIEVRQESSS